MTDMNEQRDYWNAWNAEKGARALSDVSARQKRDVLAWLDAIGRSDLDIIEVGCGAAWLTPDLPPYGRVTATDLSDEVLGDAAKRHPEIKFVAGDFMELPFDDAAFDVIVTLEVLSHVPDQPAFIAKLARMLRPGGHLMLATQNRPVLQNFNNLPPPGPGQIRRWVDKAELQGLLAAHFEVVELYSATPRANRGIWRLLNARAVNRLVRPVVGDAFERFKEARDLGWTLMALARKP